MQFQTIPEDVMRQLLEGHDDVLSPASRDLADRFQRARCPEDGSPLERHLDPKVPFVSGAILPNYQGKCTSCGKIVPV